jgi:hypothetical protein
MEDLGSCLPTAQMLVQVQEVWNWDMLVVRKG